MLNTRTLPQSYVGRFAPSPSGPLHFGSLVCALASYLHAKQHSGKWLVRIEDIDKPRSHPEISELILDTLSVHGLHWDDSVVYQSQRHALYEKALTILRRKHLIYACACSRRQIKVRGNAYDGYCRTKNLELANNAIRFLHLTDNRTFTDESLGDISVAHHFKMEDPVLKRADGIYAYHLAVVADDIAQQVTHIVRGNDLLDTTAVHLSLYQALDYAKPHYLHIPVLVQKAGEKLSKQHFSPKIDNRVPLNNLFLALQYVGVPAKLLPSINKVPELLTWAIEHWTYKMLSKQSELLILTTNGVYSAPANLFR